MFVSTLVSVTAESEQMKMSLPHPMMAMSFGTSLPIFWQLLRIQLAKSSLWQKTAVWGGSFATHLGSRFLFSDSFSLRVRESRR